jgi:oxygen-independent coproporphyrinogen III oxidase
MNELLEVSSDIETETLRDTFLNSIKNNTLPSYVYTYPLRQSYRPLEILDNDLFIQKALLQTPDNFNLYLHFPFCKQICNFCNLFSVANTESLINEYIETLKIELDYYTKLIGKQEIKTIYFGGGTPSLLSIKQLERVLEILSIYFPDYKRTCVELCIEVDPSTVNCDKVQALKSLGFNRVNIGVQSFDNKEISNIGRRYGSNVCSEAIELFKNVGIENICVDLIYGLYGQTTEEWTRSVDFALSYMPETVCIYSLVVRPTTGFSNKEYLLPDAKERYKRYDIAYKKLIEKGYQQETNVRFIQPQKGGYKQIEYHWKGATVLGIGAGARTYSTNIHYVNGYSTTQRSQVLSEYLENVREKGHNRKYGYVLNVEEQIRREFVLNLHNLNSILFFKKYGKSYWDCFPKELEVLISEGFAFDNGDSISFSPKGYKYRDLISQFFISENVKSLFENYSYK